MDCLDLELTRIIVFPCYNSSIPYTATSGDVDTSLEIAIETENAIFLGHDRVAGIMYRENDTDLVPARGPVAREG